MLEAIATVVVSIGGTLLAVWLGSRLEKNREKEQERQKQKSTITQLYREISDKITILNEIRDKIVDTDLEGSITELIASLVPPVYPLYSRQAIQTVPPLNPTLERLLSQFHSDLTRLEILGRQIMIAIPHPSALRKTTAQQYVPPGIGNIQQNEFIEQAKNFMGKGKHLTTQAIQHGEQILSELEKLL
jgi:hypothetical protein